MRPFDLADFDREDDRTTILVVDDHPDVRAYVRRHLEPDYRILEAADGAEGLEQARRFVPDLVVSDVMMPGLDGNALFRSLRDDPELELVPVVLLTAKASAESRIQGLRDGVDDYLVKPFDARELKARVDNLIASRKRLLARFETRPPQPLKASKVSVTSADAAFLARVQAVVEERLGDSELISGGSRRGPGLRPLVSPPQAARADRRDPLRPDPLAPPPARRAAPARRRRSGERDRLRRRLQERRPLLQRLPGALRRAAVGVRGAAPGAVGKG